MCGTTLVLDIYKFLVCFPFPDSLLSDTMQLRLSKCHALSRQRHLFIRPSFSLLLPYSQRPSLILPTSFFFSRHSFRSLSPSPSTKTSHAFQPTQSSAECTVRVCMSSNRKLLVPPLVQWVRDYVPENRNVHIACTLVYSHRLSSVERDKLVLEICASSCVDGAG